MTPDIEAFIQESLQPQGSTQAAATASKTLTAVVLRPPLSTAANTVSTTSANKTTVISLSQTPLSKAGLVIFVMLFFDWGNKSLKVAVEPSLCACKVVFFKNSYSLCLDPDCASAPRNNDKATVDAGTAFNGDTQRTTSQPYHCGSAADRCGQNSFLNKNKRKHKTPLCNLKILKFVNVAYLSLEMTKV